MPSLPLKAFFRFTDAVFAVMLAFLSLAILLGVGKLFLHLWPLVKSGTVTGSYIDIITDVLSLFVIIELARSLAEYFHVQRLRLTFIADAAIVSVLRDVMIGLFQKSLTIELILSLSALLLVLGALRTSAVLVFQRERMIDRSLRGKDAC
ncbi:hypothetical protein MIT9_P0029 [Methylomarinovum caldicuralii]|uniref:Phosphate-starvation-inducible E n=1 Tax=Methylomarinovum caldicuralii TaxID=438856 RepID=A0AAU9BPY1_9GAMM|nr:phosphate-starvation-inducible PsiE family protein [Methylomarinovum caldicuralii]BCX80456.1 hypothetical protein MIT9_P0029 [Methylomarinovum caldicuralii]